MEKQYYPEIIEKDTQAYWDEKASFKVTEDINKEKFYCLSMLPYPSGELHMGHVRNYTLGDVISRYQRMLGKNVLQPMSWDAFGLPAENAALKHGTAPSTWTYQNIEEMRTQLKQLGYAIDWHREFATCQPEYYRWEQWLFTRLVKKGLAYRKNSVVNWDPVDNTVLANEQVIDGRGWRSGALIEQREIPQWFLKITAYADELIQDLEQLSGWPEQVKLMQENWISRSEGVEIQFELSEPFNTQSHQQKGFVVYTTRPDTLFGTTYLAIAPQHPLAKQAAEKDPALKNFIESCSHGKLAEAEFATLEKKGLDTGLKAIHPITQKEIPIWVANYVLMEYGSGAVMAVPAHDQRDFEFAKKYALPIQPVIEAPQDFSENEKAFTGYGTLINSDIFDGLTSEEAFEAITKHLVAHKKGTIKTQYRLRDWGISRQRYWGTPVPIIYCPECGAVPVPDKDLPVVLPENIILENPISPLKSSPEFYETVCPDCGKAATRETDTFDTFIESSWYYARSTCPNQSKSMLDDRVRYWMPVDQYVGGVEHAVLHLLYARFIYKVLRDEGLVSGNEPFTRLLTQGMVLKEGSKMSKSKGNTVSPKKLIDEYGADTVRLFSIFASPPEQSLEWSDSGVEGSYRFLKRLWNWMYLAKPYIHHYSEKQPLIDPKTLTEIQKNWRKEIYEILQQATQDMERLQLNTVVSAAMKILNLLTNVPLEENSSGLITEGASILLRILSPITPHITHYLWKNLGFGNDILKATWPKVDNKALKKENINYVIQINGKLRGNITVPYEADESFIQETALADPKIQHFLNNQKPKKIIIVKNKLANIVL